MRNIIQKLWNVVFGVNVAQNSSQFMNIPDSLDNIQQQELEVKETSMSSDGSQEKKDEKGKGVGKKDIEKILGEMKSEFNRSLLKSAATVSSSENDKIRKSSRASKIAEEVATKEQTLPPDKRVDVEECSKSNVPDVNSQKTPDAVETSTSQNQAIPDSTTETGCDENNTASSTSTDTPDTEPAGSELSAVPAFVNSIKCSESEVQNSNNESVNTDDKCKNPDKKVDKSSSEGKMKGAKVEEGKSNSDSPAKLKDDKVHQETSVAPVVKNEGLEKRLVKKKLDGTENKGKGSVKSKKKIKYGVKDTAKLEETRGKVSEPEKSEKSEEAVKGVDEKLSDDSTTQPDLNKVKKSGEGKEPDSVKKQKTGNQAKNESDKKSDVKKVSPGVKKKRVVTGKIVKNKVKLDGTLLDKPGKIVKSLVDVCVKSGSSKNAKLDSNKTKKARLKIKSNVDESKPGNILSGEKRSARRTVELTGSVLQSAIARKEKSFCVLKPEEIKPKPHPLQPKISTHHVPKVSPQVKAVIMNSTVASLTKTGMISGAASLTKTGKRKYKPFKGLRYSFGQTRKKVKKSKEASSSEGSRTDQELDGNTSSTVISEFIGEDSLLKDKEDSVSSSVSLLAHSKDLPVTVSDDSVSSSVKRFSFQNSKLEPSNGTPVQDEACDSEKSAWGAKEYCDTREETSLPSAQEGTIPLCELPKNAGDFADQPNEESRIKNAAEFPRKENAISSRSKSPVIAEACQTVSQKRKHENDSSIEQNKRLCLGAQNGDIPSPSLADSSTESAPAKPECSAVANVANPALSRILCCCKTSGTPYAALDQNKSEIYCQAIDTIDGRLIGCCNVVSNLQMLRPSTKVPFVLLCDVHRQRLKIHNCCPGCGLFCSQGRYLQCQWDASGQLHHYHKKCQLVIDKEGLCPHCGMTSPSSEIRLDLRTPKNPVFLPQQQPPKKVPSAKMTCVGHGQKQLAEKLPDIVLPSSVIETITYTLPSGREVSVEGLPDDIDKEKFVMKSMFLAAKSGDAEKLLGTLAYGYNPSHQFRDFHMQTPLHVACQVGHLTIVHILVQAGAHLDVMDRDQFTPLMLAVVHEHNAIVKYLLKAGACVTLKGGDGMTALHLAAKSGNLEACYYLLSMTTIPRSFIDSQDDGGWTPLVWACEHRHTSVARFLVEKRADPLIRDTEQNIALHWSSFSGSLDISELLLNYGCDVNSTNAHGDTPLHISARQNNYDSVFLLLARGARVDIGNKDNDQALDCCPDKTCDSYIAINFNVQLRKLMVKSLEKTQRILTNDISRGKEQNPIQCVNGADDEGVPTDFVYVSENCFTSNISVDRTITSLQSCICEDSCSTPNCLCGNISLRCWYDEEGKLLPEFNYNDPPMIFECNQACKCNKVTCNNRVVQHGVVARVQLFRTDSKGWGVRTLRNIPKGSYVCEYIGEIISDCEADHREDDSYLFDLDNRDGETYCIDARRYGNIARFINHMCVPNLLPVKVFIDHQDLHFPRIAFFANRDIEADEELGFDYGEKFWIIKCKSFTCTCGAEKCRYSESTIQQTLDNYNRRLMEENQ